MKKKLKLSRETLRDLQVAEFEQIAGAAADFKVKTIDIGKTNEISICLGCTTPLDGCTDGCPIIV